MLLVDKPGGASSNGVLQRVRHLLEARKAGHGGTLDPMATGVLVVCFGEATKFASALLDGGKSYAGRIRLGIRTTTADADGEVVETRPVVTDGVDLTGLAHRFTGTIVQVPPAFSALKHQGRPLYEYAREGIEVPSKSREITIHALRLGPWEGNDLRFEVDCSSGTYVRTLAEDLAAAMGTVGHLTMLRRTASGRFGVADAITPDALEGRTLADRESLLMSSDCLLASLPAVTLDASSATSIRQGRVVEAAAGLPGGRRRLYGPTGAFLGVGEVCPDGRIQPIRLLATGSDPDPGCSTGVAA